MTTRGLRINNPFNIRITETHWLGKIDSSDPEFEQFDTMEHGLRAGYKNLLTAEYKHGRDTIRKIITAYAPPDENDTEHYIAEVCKRTEFGENDHIDLDQKSTLVNMGMAICCQEQGQAVLDEISADLFDSAAEDALA